MEYLELAQFRNFCDVLFIMFYPCAKFISQIYSIRRSTELARDIRAIVVGWEEAEVEEVVKRRQSQASCFCLRSSLPDVSVLQLLPPQLRPPPPLAMENQRESEETWHRSRNPGATQPPGKSDQKPNWQERSHYCGNCGKSKKKLFEKTFSWFTFHFWSPSRPQTHNLADSLPVAKNQRWNPGLFWVLHEKSAELLNLERPIIQQLVFALVLLRPEPN